jgi:hypothetical protein
LIVFLRFFRSVCCHFSGQLDGEEEAQDQVEFKFRYRNQRAKQPKSNEGRSNLISYRI